MLNTIKLSTYFYLHTLTSKVQLLKYDLNKLNFIKYQTCNHIYIQHSFLLF